MKKVLLMIAVAAALLVGCGGGGVPPVPTVAEVLDHPDVYANETVIVAGRVGEVLGPNAFTLVSAEGGRQGNTGGQAEDARRILVLRADPAEVTRRLGVDGRVPVFEGNEVVVAGPLTVFDAEELGERLGASLEAFEAFEGQPVIVAVVVHHALRPEQQ